MDKKKKSIEFEGLEDWMEQFFSDPLSSYLDEQHFRIDVFETQNEYIIEADLPNFAEKQIIIEMNKDMVKINVQKSKEVLLERTVWMPFNLLEKEAFALFEKGILEVHIMKDGNADCNEKQIPIRYKK
jgi:HSP20 family molecular chaperone IbpA